MEWKKLCVFLKQVSGGAMGKEASRNTGWKESFNKQFEIKVQFIGCVFMLFEISN
jgi:hypothetical protein